MPKKSYSFDRFKFESQKDLDDEVKKRLNHYAKDIEVYDELLLAVVNNLHEGVIKHNQKCTKLKFVSYKYQPNSIREKYRGNLFVTGYFEPYNEWHGVTLYPYKNNKPNPMSIATEILRLKWADLIAPEKENNVCEECGECCNVQAHHENTSFKDIAIQCISMFTIGDTEYDWWEHETPADKIPNNHPAVLEMIRLHKFVTYKWLCSECHKKCHKNQEKLEL